MQPSDKYCLLITTCNTEDSAKTIAKTLVAEKLAACVNIIDGVTSVYQWKQNVEMDQEFILIVKTQKPLAEQIESRLKQLHPYELPEIIAVPIESGSNEYLNWLSENLIT